MAKKKKSMALFEVIAKSRQDKREPELSVPQWMRHRDESSQTPAEGGKKPIPVPTTLIPPQAAVEQPSLQVTPVEPAPARPQPISRPAAEPGAAEPVFSTRGGRLSLSLNYVSCTVALLGLVLLLAVVFLLGRASVGDKPATNGGPKQAAAAAAQPPAESWAAGKYYLQIQAMGGLSDALRDEARLIARYCTDAKVPAKVVRTATQYEIRSTTPFDSAASSEALQFAQRIDALGKRYKTLYGKPYDFSQHDRDGRFRPRYGMVRGAAR